jgi:hypothetical protein
MELLSKHGLSDKLNSAPGDRMKGVRQITVSPLSVPTPTVYVKQNELENCYLFFFLFNLCFGRTPQRVAEPSGRKRG